MSEGRIVLTGLGSPPGKLFGSPGSPGSPGESWPSKGPDYWVERNPNVWRHGKWSQETPMDLLERSGFLTPNDLFFVRSH